MGVRGGVILSLVGVVLLFGASRERHLLTDSSSEPQEITCADLGQLGPGDNINIVLKDCRYGLNAFVFQNITGKAEHNWSKVWIPAYPKNWPSGGPFRVLIVSDEIQDQGDLDRFARKKTLAGMVMNSVDDLEDDERDLLDKEYPGTDFSLVSIVEHNRKPPTLGFLVLYAGAGLALLIAGIVVLKAHFTG